MGKNLSFVQFLFPDIMLLLNHVHFLLSNIFPFYNSYIKQPSLVLMLLLDKGAFLLSQAEVTPL